MKFEIDLDPYIRGIGENYDSLIEMAVEFFHEGRARFVEDVSLVYGVGYAIFWICFRISWICLFMYLSFKLIKWVRDKALSGFRLLRVKRYVKPLSVLECPPYDPSKAHPPPPVGVGPNREHDIRDGLAATVREPVKYTHDKHPLQLPSTFLLQHQAIKEMAMPTSAFIPTDKRYVTTDGVMSVRSGNIVIGMASCIGYSTYGPCLVTAAHVWSELWKSGDAYLEHNDKTYPVNFKWKVLLDSSPHDLDIVVIAVPHPVFAALGVKKLKTGSLKTASRCVTFGFDDGHYFGTSTGRIEHKPREAFRCRHYASTTFGFSGSPLIVSGEVVGIHTGGELGILGTANLGTLLFWNDKIRCFESDTTSDVPYVIEDQLPAPADRIVRYNTGNKAYSVEQVGRSVKLRFKPMNFDEPLTFDRVSSNWAEDELEEWEIARKRVKETKTVDFDVICEDSPKDFPVEDRSPRTKPSSMDNLSGFVPDTFMLNNDTIVKLLQVLASSQTSQTTKSASRRAKKRVKAIHKVSDSLTSESVLTKSMEKIEKPLPVSTKPLKDGQISQSGVFQSAEQTQSLKVSSSKLVDSNVLVVRFTRRQEKLYNRVCQTRKYQQLWSTLGYEEKGFLRRQLLEFVSSSKINLRETQVQDFLAQFSLEITPRC